MSMPEPAAATKPTAGIPVSTVTAKPVMAATSMMPSEPRLMTPERSLTSRPSEASIRGVPATMADATRGARASMSVSPAQAVVNQDIAGQQRKQQYALEHTRDGAGHAQPALGKLAADIEQGHDEAAEHHPQGVQTTNESHNDGGKAIARRNGRRQLPDWTHGLGGASQTRQTARHQQHRPQGAF